MVKDQPWLHNQDSTLQLSIPHPRVQFVSFGQSSLVSPGAALEKIPKASPWVSQLLGLLGHGRCYSAFGVLCVLSWQALQPTSVFWSRLFPPLQSLESCSVSASLVLQLLVEPVTSGVQATPMCVLPGAWTL